MKFLSRGRSCGKNGEFTIWLPTQTSLIPLWLLTVVFCWKHRAGERNLCLHVSQFTNHPVLSAVRFWRVKRMHDAAPWFGPYIRCSFVLYTIAKLELVAFLYRYLNYEFVHALRKLYTTEPFQLPVLWDGWLIDSRNESPAFLCSAFFHRMSGWGRHKAGSVSPGHLLCLDERQKHCVM